MTTLPVAVHRSAELSVHEGGSGFNRFIQQAMQAPFLTQEEERELAVRYRRHNDLEAAHRLVQSHLRLVLKTAREYLNYRLSLPDLVQEGTIGLMHAVKKFDPARGARLSTYAIWWIRAAIHDFILRSWRMVKIATTQLKRQLFFKLRQAKGDVNLLDRDEAEELAERFGTDADTILEVDARMSGADTSINQPLFDDAGEMIDLIADHRPNQEHELSNRQQGEAVALVVHHAMAKLNPREQVIVAERLLSDPPLTLETLAERFSISCERVRQIEKRALEKLKASIRSAPEARDLIPAVCPTV